MLRAAGRLAFAAAAIREEERPAEMAATRRVPRPLPADRPWPDLVLAKVGPSKWKVNPNELGTLRGSLDATGVASAARTANTSQAQNTIHAIWPGRIFGTG